MSKLKLEYPSVRFVRDEDEDYMLPACELGAEKEGEDLYIDALSKRDFLYYDEKGRMIEDLFKEAKEYAFLALKYGDEEDVKEAIEAMDDYRRDLVFLYSVVATIERRF